MNACRFSLEYPVQYHWSGKFVGKNQNWKHMERTLYDYELIVMEKGTLYIEDEWQKYEVKEGEYLLMSPTKCQKGYKASKCCFYWMHFTATEQLDENCEIRIERQGKLLSDERMFVLLKQLQDTDLRYMDTAYNAYLATSILYELSNQQKEVKKNTSEEANLVDAVSDYVVTHFSDSIHVSELAQHFGYNEKYFSTAFRKKSGVGVKQFIDQKKMERAKFLLLNTDAWVVEIAELLGYENVQNFYHVFKKETNCTPTEFRTNYGKKNEFDI